MARRAFAEVLGTALLLIAVVGSGIAAQRLSPGDTGLELLENAMATAAALVAIILALGPVSGAHLNPVVTLATRLLGRTTTPEAGIYALAQLGGGVGGTVVANLMFSRPAVEWSTRTRTGGGLWLAEAVATFGLVLIIFCLVENRRIALVPFAVGTYIAGAYFFTSSTSFANPAVTVARTLTDTFSGIRPSSAPPFIAFQLVGACAAVAAVRVLYPRGAEIAVAPEPSADGRVPAVPVEAP